jgi:site-specific DNA recombinase
MRILGATRLSRRTDESTSIERQRERITLRARADGHTLVHVTEDTDVSGSISPFDRESLGPWLTDPDKIDQWDALMVVKLDRLTRSLTHFDTMVDWCDRHGKTLVGLDENLDLSTSVGRMFANILAMFAQFERGRIAERRREAAAKMRENGWWQGGRPPYGMRPVKVGDHWELEIDPDKIKLLYEIANQMVAGKSAGSIARDLNEAHVPAPFGKAWRQPSIRRMFTNPNIPLDHGTRARVLDALDETKVTWTRRHDAAMLLNIAYCRCGYALHAKKFEARGKDPYSYYVCSNKCGAKAIPANQLELVVEERMTDDEDWGLVPVLDKIVSPGKSYKTDIRLIERKIHALDLDADDYDERHAELTAERKRLVNLDKSHRERDRVAWEDAGLTLGDYWPTLDTQTKRQFLLENHFRLEAERVDRRYPPRVVWNGPQISKVVRVIGARVPALPLGRDVSLEDYPDMDDEPPEMGRRSPNVQ